MPLYKYSEKDVDGQVSHDVLDAISAEQLIKDRYKRGRYVFQVQEADTYIKRSALKDRALADFSSEISVLLSSGVPVVRALEIMSAESGVPQKMKTMYNNMVTLLSRGYTFAEAMRLQGGAFPELIVSVYDSGELSGKLSLAADKMALYYDKMNKIQQKIKSATAYPKFVAALTFVITILIFTVILPQFLDSTNTTESALPMITVVMMKISFFLRERYIVLLTIVGIIIYAYFFLKRIPAYKILTGKLIIQMPGIAKQLKMIYTARFSTTLSNLYLSGVPLASALEAAAKTIGNAFVEREYVKSRADIACGRPLSTALRHMTGLNARMYQVVMIGEETGKLGEVLENMGNAFDSEVDTAITKMIAVLSPMLLVVMTAIIGLAMAGIMLPLMQSYQNMT